MSLADDLHEIKAQAFRDLEAVHAFFANTKRAWRIVQQFIHAGERIAFENSVTGDTRDEQALLDNAQNYASDFLASSTFQHFIALFEKFFFDLLRLWLAADPRSLSGEKVELREILSALDRNAIVLSLVDRKLNELKYRRLDEWFTHLRKLTKIPGPSTEEIEQLAEIKASRDILVHNSGVVNDVYLAKAGARARFALGETLVIPDDYHRASWEAIRKIVGDLADAVIAKVSPVPPAGAV